MRSFWSLHFLKTSISVQNLLGCGCFVFQWFYDFFRSVPINLLASPQICLSLFSATLTLALLMWAYQFLSVLYCPFLSVSVDQSVCLSVCQFFPSSCPIGSLSQFFWPSTRARVLSLTCGEKGEREIISLVHQKRERNSGESKSKGKNNFARESEGGAEGRGVKGKVSFFTHERERIEKGREREREREKERERERERERIDKE